MRMTVLVVSYELGQHQGGGVHVGGRGAGRVVAGVVGVVGHRPGAGRGVIIVPGRLPEEPAEEPVPLEVAHDLRLVARVEGGAGLEVPADGPAAGALEQLAEHQLPGAVQAADARVVEAKQGLQPVLPAPREELRRGDLARVDRRLDPAGQVGEGLPIAAEKKQRSSP
jgi:hypothetical protein